MPKQSGLLVYPVSNIDAAKTFFNTLLDAEPYVDSPYYVGYKIGEQEIGLDPHGQSAGPIAYWESTDINASIEDLVRAGATVTQEPKDVANGLLVALVTDPNGNLVGLRQNP